MRINYKHILNSYQYRIGSGFVNNLITKVPIEFHLPGYQYSNQSLQKSSSGR